jgi:hypothetical protein
MDGPIDPSIEPVKKNDPARRRPPGGKALLRLLQHLERRGFAELAEAAVALAVPDEAREEFHKRAMAFGTAPRGPTAVPGPDVHALTAQVAQEYKSAALKETVPVTGAPTPSGPQWRSLGPWTIPNGQTYGSSRVNVSGRVAAIAVDPGNPAHVLCGSANGGVWESFDRGASWAPRTDYAATLTVGALAYDPNTPTVVYCGTGEGNWWAWLGAGILKSTNGGTTWSTLCTEPFMGQGFYDLIVDRANSQHLVAATTVGLYVSTNAGVNWTQRRSVTTWSLSIAGTETLAASRDGLYRSSDGGSTWNALPLPGSPGSFDRLAVAIAPSDATIAYVWGASGSAACTAAIWRAASGKSCWRRR